jgi:type II secretion system protein J
MRPTIPVQPARRAFTLIEVLLAVAIFSVVLVAINTVFYTALRLRKHTTEALERSLPLDNALAIMRRDLMNTMPIGGNLASSFRDGPIIVGTSMGQYVGLEFFTTTGVLKDDEPWGDIQKVTYALVDPPARAQASSGKDLVRFVTRNLLPLTEEDPEQQRLLSGVDRLEFTCFDGMNWRDLWDTTTTDTNMPLAVRIRIALVPDERDNARNRQPYELMVPFVIQPLGTNTTTATTGGTGG